MALFFSMALHAIVLVLPLPPSESTAKVVFGSIRETERGRTASWRLVESAKEKRSARLDRDMSVPQSATYDREGHQVKEAVERGRYYPSDLLTRSPEALSEVILGEEYLLSAWPEGLAKLGLWIEADGRVSHIEVEASDYPDNLTAALRTAFWQLSFRPGEVGGRGVPVYLRIEVSFKNMGGLPH